MRKPLKIVLPWEPRAITVIGDPHLDAPSHNRERFLEDMQWAKDNGDLIWIIGDVWNAILPQDLKRSSGSHRKAKVNAGDEEVYDDLLGGMVNAATKVLLPFVDNIEVIMVGNHETAVLKYHGSDMVRALVQELNHSKKKGVFASGHIQHGGYKCWLQLQFKKSERMSASQFGWFHHGIGGSAQVTKGTITMNRIKVGNWFDFGAMGHTHTEVFDRDRVEYMDSYGNLKRKDRDFAIVGGYSGEDDGGYDPGEGGYRLDWGDEKFAGHEAQGPVRFKFRPVASSGTYGVRRGVEVPETWE